MKKGGCMFGGGEVKRKEGVRGWWGKKGKEKRKRKEVVCGWWKKKKKGGEIQWQQRKCGRKIEKEGILRVMKYKKK